MKFCLLKNTSFSIFLFLISFFHEIFVNRRNIAKQCESASILAENVGNGPL
jgi:hypothetical protein